MDIMTGNTEAILRYHRFHERLNRSLKMQAIGLGFLADELAAGVGTAAIKQRVDTRGDLWGGMPDWNNVAEDVAFAVRDLGQAGVARAFSAFDLFMEQIAGELASWRDFSGAGPIDKSDVGDPDDNAIEDKVDRFYSRLGASRTRISDIWAVYRYFRFARDCIVHREGIASSGLSAAAEAPELKPTLERWMVRTGERTVPALVPVAVGEPLGFSHRQALAASSTLRLVALDIGRLVISQLGLEGFVYLAARRTFLDEQAIAAIDPKATMVKTFNAVMAGRYRVRDYDHVEALRALRELNLTKRCSARFNEITSQQS
ncbi:hypothetical protein [Sphingomonas faeni]|uniref:hypothetical protein n=1 Tax=Sphingomonas faeni TaxID=185950 RepID=UPI003361315C